MLGVAMEMTCMDCVSWTQFVIVIVLAAGFLLAGIVAFRALQVRNRVVAFAALTACYLPCAWLLVRAYRLLFGPNWHGALLR